MPAASALSYLSSLCPAPLLLQKNSASTEVKIPHTQMAMELMAPGGGRSPGLGGTHGVAAGAYGLPLRHRVCDAEAVWQTEGPAWLLPLP